MMTHYSPFFIDEEAQDDARMIEALQAIAFGPGRFARTAFLVRRGIPPVPGLSFVAKTVEPMGQRLVGAVRYTAVTANGQVGLLLGPLVVHPDLKGRGCGLSLLRKSLEAARLRSFPWVILVGDLPYYHRAGFSRMSPGQLSFPGPVDPARVLGIALGDIDVTAISGMVTAIRL